MKSSLSDRLNAAFERRLPEQRLFLKTDRTTRFVRLRPATQAAALGAGALLVGWTIVSTAILTMDSLGAGDLRDQAQRRREAYEARLEELASARDARAREAERARARFEMAMTEVSAMQDRLLAGADRRRELDSGLGALRRTLARTVDQRDTARRQADAFEARLEAGPGEKSPTERLSEATTSLDYVTAALSGTAAERDELAAAKKAAETRNDKLQRDLRLIRARNDRIFSRLEDALSSSVKPLKKMFANAGVSAEKMIQTARKGYEGQGGPLRPLSISTKGRSASPDQRRANDILGELDVLNLYRRAAEKAPFAGPVRAKRRLTSPFGVRHDPINGGSRMHEGVDLAAPLGTPIYSTADGTVVKAGWLSGYGRVVKIRHALGIETLYAHMSKIRVEKGQKVSRGQRIGDMGSSGRSTGSHTHYEVLVDGKPVDPMTYIEAARYVF